MASWHMNFLDRLYPTNTVFETSGMTLRGPSGELGYEYSQASTLGKDILNKNF